VGNDNKQKQKPNGEIDPFSRFIFGNRKQRETYKESENNSQELPEQNEQSSFDNRSNRTDDWFFGSRRKEPTQSVPTIQNQIEDYINNVDIELLMETFDTLVTTSKQLKPLMKEITPFFHRFSKKFKSN
jgi:5-methylcytosine-specific restriction endonuclease McrBC regulatory subunit McrC